MKYKKSPKLNDCKISYFTGCLKICIELAIFICLIVLYYLSKNDPFENHIIGDLSDYFNDVENLSPNKENTLGLNESDNNLNETKDILYKDKNESSKNNLSKELFKRRLVSKSFCNEIRDNFEKFKGENLSTIFDLNYKKIRKYIKANLIIYIITILLVIVSTILFCKKIKDLIIGSLMIIILLLYVTRFILSVILFYYIEKGDLEKYDNFLDCENVNKGFFNEFSKVKNIRKCFIAFFVLNIISQGLEKCDNCCGINDINEKKDKKANEENTQKNMNITLPNNTSSEIIK